MTLSTKSTRSVARYGREVCLRAAAMKGEQTSLGDQLKELVGMAEAGRTPVDSPSRLELAQAAGAEIEKIHAEAIAAEKARAERNARQAEANRIRRAEMAAKRAEQIAHRAAMASSLRKTETLYAEIYVTVQRRVAAAVATVEQFREDLAIDPHHAFRWNDSGIAAAFEYVGSCFLDSIEASYNEGADVGHKFFREILTSYGLSIQNFALRAAESHGADVREIQAQAKLVDEIKYLVQFAEREAAKAVQS